MSAKNINHSWVDIGGGRVQIKIECDKGTASSIFSLLMQNGAREKSVSKASTKTKELPIRLNSGGRGPGWLRAKIIEDMENFCEKYDVAPTNLGLQALKDGSFFGRLKKARKSAADEKRSPTIDRVERLYDYMESYSKGAR